MNVFVFTGPTISPNEAATELPAVYLPPAGEGDIYRAALHQPLAIGLIDGYFDSTPAVRHKEILWAMSRGIHVFGAASMGALRAVELAVFGMIGVGRVFESYRNGTLEDDDEVAIAHRGEEAGFRPISEAMVNIRETLGKARLAGVITNDLRLILEKIAKDLFYPDRSYSMVLRRASSTGVSETELGALREWLPDGLVNQKREDALSMLRLIRQEVTQGLKPKTVSYFFAHTSMWEGTCRQSGELRLDSNLHPMLVRLELIQDELRLEDTRYREYLQAATGRVLAMREAERAGVTITEISQCETETVFRNDLGLHDCDDFNRWLATNGLNQEQFEALMADETRVRWVEERAQTASVSALPNQLRLSGDYPRLVQRAMAKNRFLQSQGLSNLSLKDAGLTESQLWQWYFMERLGQSIPADLDEHAQKIGFASLREFRRALCKEYLYRCGVDQSGLTQRST